MIKTLYFFLFVIVSMLLLYACTASPKEYFTNLSADQFERLLEDESIQRLDVRTVAEYSSGHIPGSLNINVLENDFLIKAEEILDKNLPVALYCKSGRRSREAAQKLSKAGFKVYNLDKGIEDWKEHGKPLE